MSNSGEAEYLGAGNKGWEEDELLGGLITELVDRIWGWTNGVGIWSGRR